MQLHKNYLFDLSNCSSLEVRGEQAQAFLQGQLSCDLRQVTANTMRQGALCNLKGRILALLDIIDWHGLQLILPDDLLNSTQASLAKAALLSRVELKPTTSYQFYGFYLQNPQDVSPISIEQPQDRYGLFFNDEACCYSLGHSMYVILMRKEHSHTLIKPFLDCRQISTPFAWHQLLLKNKQVRIYPETRGLFLPHRLDLHRSGYLSFDKGCYKGQEIIARMHYRSKLKHSLQLVTIKTPEPLAAGQKIFDDTATLELGELIDFSPFSSNEYLAAVSILIEHPSVVRIEGHSVPVVLTNY